MTLMIAVPTSLLAGYLVRPLLPRLGVVAGVWYVCLVAQSWYLAKPGRTGFGGVEGTEALRGVLYWALQPVLLVACFAVAQVGAALRERQGARAS